MKSKVFLAGFLFAFALPFAHSQAAVFKAEGSGSGPTRAEAEDAAKIDAVSSLVLREMKRDRVYRDLVVREAFREGWFASVSAERSEDGSWKARALVELDPGVADALYYGRYSTTVGALLDQAEIALAEIEGLLSEGGGYESSASLPSAETAYRRAEAKADEALGYLGPVEDAVFFSSTGKRKAPELKSLLDSYRSSARDGVGRVRESQARLSVDEGVANSLSLLDQVDAEVDGYAADADELASLARSPASYGADALRAAQAQGRAARDALGRRREAVRSISAGLEPGSYAAARARLTLDRAASVDRSLASSLSALSGELAARHPAVRAAAWLADHEPSGYLSVGCMLPFGVGPSGGSTVVESLPARAEVRAEGAFGDAGGVWLRSIATFGAESAFAESAFAEADGTITQSALAGFYGRAVMGAGLRWDWLRRGPAGEAAPSRTAACLAVGGAGKGLGSERTVPFWIAVASWELAGPGDFVLARDLNLALDLEVRPNPWFRFEASAASRARGGSTSDELWRGSAAVGMGFRLPVLRPVLWRVRWEGERTAPIRSGNAAFADGDARGAFRFGLEYAF